MMTSCKGTSFNQGIHDTQGTMKGNWHDFL